MLKMLYTDIRSVLLNKGFRIIIEAFVSYILFFTILMKVLAFFLGGGLSADDILTAYPDIGVFVITAATLLMFVNEYKEGVMKCKIQRGISRKGIFLSAVITSAFMAVIMTIIAAVIDILLILIFSEGLYTMTISELGDAFLQITFASMAIAVFSTSLIMVLGGGNSSYVVGLIIAFVFKIVGMLVMDKLYPEKGLCPLTGFKLKLYTFYDRFVPYAHFTFSPRWDSSSNMIGCLGLILISVIVGMLMFERKEIN